jgi:hypothetical protein
MRTTISLEDSIYNEIKELCHSRNIPIKTAINLLLAKGLHYLKNDREKPDFTQQTYSLGKPYSEYDLIKALESAGELEVAEIKRKLDLRK